MTYTVQNTTHTAQKQKETSDLIAHPHASFMKRCAAIFIHSVYISTLINQQLGHLSFIFSNGNRQWGLHVTVNNI